MGKETVSLPVDQIGEKVNEWSKEVLGTAVEVLPGGQELKEKINLNENSPAGEESDDQTETEAAKIIEIQTKEIIETIKKLPEEQVKQIKRQIFEEFCREVLEEE